MPRAAPLPDGGEIRPVVRAGQVRYQVRLPVPRTMRRSGQLTRTCATPEAAASALAELVDQRATGRVAPGKPRRARGEGTVTYRASRRHWVARFPVPRSVRACGYVEAVAPTERAARRCLATLRRDHEGGRLSPGGQQTVAAYLAEWLSERIRPHRTAKTATDYAGHIRRYLVPALGHLTLAELTPRHVQQMVNGLLQRGRSPRRAGGQPGPLAPRTVQYAHAVLRAALNDAVADERILRNPATRVSLPPVPRSDAQALTLAQAQALLTAVRGHRLEVAYHVAVVAGLREGEVCGLRWSDLNLERGHLTIRASAGRADGQLRIKDTKSHRQRPIVLPPALVERLRRHRDAQAEERRLMADRWREHGLVFPSRVGTILEPRNLLRHLQETRARVNRERRQAWAKAGQAGEPPDLLPPVTFHELRHTAASLLLAQGVPLKVVSEILGHAQISLTADLYGHVYAEARQEAAARMGEVLHRLDGQPPTATVDHTMDATATPPMARSSRQRKAPS